MNDAWLLLLPIVIPFLGAALCRDSLSATAQRACTFAALCLNLAALAVITWRTPALGGLLRADTVALFFAWVMGGLWLIASVYAFGYMAHEERPAQFFRHSLMTLGTLMLLCFAASIWVFFIGFAAMTLLSAPMIRHEEIERKYISHSLMGLGMAIVGLLLLLPSLSGSAFTACGALQADKLAQHRTLAQIGTLLMLLGFGAKAGIYPLHGWLPLAHPVAPACASAVLSGVITKVGVLGVLRVITGITGAAFLRGSWVQYTLLGLTLFTILMGSLMASQEGLLKRRLAWSSVSQVSYVLFGIATLHPLGLIGALLHVVAHGVIKNTLFMGAGAIIHQTGQTRVEELRGIGRQMPATLWCFTLASLGLIGIPPCIGFISKWYLGQGSLQMTAPGWLQVLGVVILIISALLTAGYLLPICLRGFFPGADTPETAERCDPGWRMVLPMALLVGLTVLLGCFPGRLIDLFASLGGLL